MLMKTNNSNKVHRTYVGLASQEYHKIESQYKASTCRTLSEYIRKLLYNKPVTIFYRNQSLDDLIEEIVVFNKEMNTLRDNLAQIVEKLYIHPQISEFKPSVERIELEINKVQKSIEDIKIQFKKITDKWLQS